MKSIKSLLSGKAHGGKIGNSAHRAVAVGENDGGGETEDGQAACREPAVTRIVARRLVATPMHLAIDLDDQPGGMTIEVSRVRPGWMLSSELQPGRPRPECAPEHHLG